MPRLKRSQVVLICFVLLIGGAFLIMSSPAAMLAWLLGVVTQELCWGLGGRLPGSPWRKDESARKVDWARVTTQPNLLRSCC